MPTPSPVRTKGGAVLFRVQYRLTPGGTPTSDRFDTYREALAFCALIDRVGPLAARQIREATTLAGDEGVLTCRDAFTQFVDHVSSYAEEGTVAKYETTWALHIGPTFDDWPIGQVGRPQVEKWIASLRKKETLPSIRRRKRDKTVEPDYLSTKTIANIQGLFSSVLSLQVDSGALARNPAKGVRLPAAHQKRSPVFLTTRQRLDLLSATPARWQTLVAFLLATGLRWGEATALYASDFDFDSTPPTVRVERAWKRGKTGHHIGPPKSKKSKRTVSLPRSLVDELEALAASAGKGLVFQGPNGGRLRPEWFSENVWAKAIAKAKLDPRPRIHDLRHTHASMLLGAGVPIHIVQYRMGHESIETTVNVYGHLVPDAGRIAADATEMAMATALPQLLPAAG
ncbi:tyrosine-type recombinase/integrase [Actinomyces culturomici]|uniref:tyrosine-type recombinase/integrase n=1 Tax=Actinomyces culturomici TaxID=1926276 RepID=UPI00135A0655|nr:site-specific integrase [Actinomyces culturomici]